MRHFLLTLAAASVLAPAADAACCYFSAKNADILQPAQKVFITFDPALKVETFTVQPKFEGNALDFGMVIPTPSKPKLDTMPRDFFKHLAVYGILKKRVQPTSKLLPPPPPPRLALGRGAGGGGIPKNGKKKSTVVVLESGVVGSLDYKIISADRADDLYQWLKDNKYSYAGDEATLNHYVQKKWIFTVMKIDTMQMKRNKDGSFAGEVTPTRFQFASEKLIYPLKITQISVKDKTEALFYVQAPHKADLPGDNTYQYTWIPMLQAATGCTPGGIQGGGEEWVKALGGQAPVLVRRAQELGFNFIPGNRPQPNKQGRIPTTMEWARKLTADDVKFLKGELPYCEKVPNVDEGFSEADIRAVVYGHMQRLHTGFHDRWQTGQLLARVTVNRYCSSSLQTIRMAAHAIKAGEGDVFVAGGVETVSRYLHGASDTGPHNSAFADAEARTAERTGGADSWEPPAGLPDIYIAMGQTAENVATLRGLDRRELDEFGVRSQNLAEKAIADGFWAREITPVTLPDGTVVSTDDGPRAGVTYDAIAGLKPVFREDGVVTAGNCCALNDGAAAVVIMSDPATAAKPARNCGTAATTRRSLPILASALSTVPRVSPAAETSRWPHLR